MVEYTYCLFRGKRMYIDLLNNLAIAAAFLFLAGKFYENGKFDFASSIKIKIIAGLATGALGTLLMASTIIGPNNVIIDLRHLSILIAAVYSGPVAAMIGTIIIAIMRLIIYGISTASLFAAGNILLIGLFCAFIAARKMPVAYKHLLMNLFSLIMISIFFYLLVPDFLETNQILAYYWPTSILAGAFIYAVSEYIKKSIENNRLMSYFKAVAENSNDLISTHKRDGNFIYVSPSVISLLGYTPEELIGKSPYSLIHPESFNDVEKAHEASKRRETNTVVYKMKRKDGQYIWVESTAKTMSHIDNKPTEIVVISRNITYRKTIEEDLMRKNALLEKLSYMDGLTQIHNRRFFDINLEKEWNRSARHAASISIILFDIDHFKAYNDTYGHQQGDECLKLIAKTAEAILKRPGDFISRYGGEEFAVILPDTDLDGAMMVAEKIRSSIEGLKIPNIHSSVLPIVTVSAGVQTAVPAPGSDCFRFIEEADKALYLVKNNGRNHVRHLQQETAEAQK